MTNTQSVKKMSDEAIVERLKNLSDTLGVLEQEAGEQMDALYEESDQALAALERSGDELDSRLTAVSEQAARQIEDELAETEEEIRREEEILDAMSVVRDAEGR